MNVSHRLLVCALAGWTAFLNTPLPAQVLYGSLTGNVADSSNAAVVNAKVEVINVATGIGRQASSDDHGAFRFSDLQPGVYKITISAPSFRTLIQEGVTIEVNTVVRADARLEVAQLTETVTVSASAVTLQSDRADVNNQIRTTELTNLPIGGQRNFQNLYRILPGFSPPSEAHSIAGNPQRALVTNVNGVSFSNNNTKFDGATISYPWLPHIVAYVPPSEALETVNVVTNSFDAEQGMAGGAAINVTLKSGTNDFHGSAFWYHTNSVLRARNFFFVGNKLPKNILNQPGFTLGGPILKNKLFFFADWERMSNRQNNSRFFTIPWAALRQGDFSGTGTTIYDPQTGNANGSGRQPFPGNRIPAPRFDSASSKLIQNLPQPNLGPLPNQNHFASASLPYDRDSFDIKLNYNPTQRSSLFTRYSRSTSSLFDPQPLGLGGGDAFTIQPGNATGLVQSAAIGGTYTLSPQLLIDGTAGFTRQVLGAENVDLDKKYGSDVLGIPGTNGPERLQGGYPSFGISGFSSLGNPSASNPFKFRDNQYVGALNVGWVRGSHQLRFGWEVNRFAINHFQPQAAFGPRGGFSFNGGLTSLPGGANPNQYNGFADFLLGLANRMGKDVQYINPAAVRMWSNGFYARDQWQLTRSLTLTFGLRYEIYPFATRDHRGAERYDPLTDKVYVGGLAGVPGDSGVDVGHGGWAPRIGVAYRLHDKTVIRAGYGISVDPNSFRGLRDAYPATISTQFSGNSIYEAAGSFRTGIPEVQGPSLSAGILDLPLAVGTFTVPRDFRRGYIQSFNFTLQRDLGAGLNLQAGYVGSRAIRQTAQININAAPPGGGNTGRALFPQFGRIANITQLTPFRTAAYNSLQTQLTRRFAGGGMFGVSYTFSKAINYDDNSDSGLSYNWEPAFGRNKGIAGFDRTHNLQVYGVYDLPLGRGKRFLQARVADWLAGGWQINAVMSRMSGTPFTVGASGASLNAPGNGQSADQVNPNVSIPGGHGRGASYFDPLAFEEVFGTRFGTSGRNILRGPGLFNLDLGLFRTFRIRERFALQFRAEAFGATNTPQFGNPGANVSSPVRNGDRSIRALNGYTEILSAGGERQLRFALRLSF